MIITKTTLYNRTYKKEIVKKNLQYESIRISNIEAFLISKNNLQEVINDPLHVMYGITKKSGPLKEYYTAKVNDKMRLFMKPVGEYPYKTLEIVEIIFEKVDNTHYEEG